MDNPRTRRNFPARFPCSTCGSRRESRCRRIASPRPCSRRNLPAPAGCRCDRERTIPWQSVPSGRHPRPGWPGMPLRENSPILNTLSFISFLFLFDPARGITLKPGGLPFVGYIPVMPPSCGPPPGLPARRPLRARYRPPRGFRTGTTRCRKSSGEAAG